MTALLKGPFVSCAHVLCLWQWHHCVRSKDILKRDTCVTPFSNHFIKSLVPKKLEFPRPQNLMLGERQAWSLVPTRRAALTCQTTFPETFNRDNNGSVVGRTTLLPEILSYTYLLPSIWTRTYVTAPKMDLRALAPSHFLMWPHQISPFIDVSLLFVSFTGILRTGWQV